MKDQGREESAQTQAARKAFRAALKSATDDARKVIKPGDRVSRTMCGGIRSTFTFTHWDSDWLCGRTVTDCAAASVYAVNGQPMAFGCTGLIEVTTAELVDALNADRAARRTAE